MADDVDQLFQERFALMRDEQVVHVGRMILFLGQDMLEHDARGGIVIAEEANKLLIMFDDQQ